MPGKARQATTVFIVGEDSHRGIAVRRLLADEPHIAVIGESGESEDSLGEIRTLLPDVVVIDVGITPKTEFASRLHAEAPENSIIALVHPEDCFTKDLLQFGVTGVVTCENVRADLAPAIHAVTRGDVFLSNSLVGPVINGYRQSAAEGIFDTALTGANSGSSGGVSRVLIELLSGELAAARVQKSCLRDVAADGRDRQAWCDYLAAITHLHAYRLDEALHHFSVGVHDKLVLNLRAAIDSFAGLALTQQLLQQQDAAARTLDDLLEFAQETCDASCVAVAHSCRARVCLLQGDLDAALGWARVADETPGPDEIFISLEVPVITRARVLIAGASDEDLVKASELLTATRQRSVALRHRCQTIEVAVLQSLLLDRQGKTTDSNDALVEALALAQPGGWIRPFVELGRPMTDLLRRQDPHVHTGFVAQILNSRRVVAEQAAAQGAATPVFCDLTNRELDILELISQRLQNKQIAARLFITPETVKTHLKHLYEKLNVHSRHEAAARGARILAVNTIRFDA